MAAYTRGRCENEGTVNFAARDVSNRRLPRWSPIYSRINRRKFREEGAVNDKGNRSRGKLHREMAAKRKFRLIDPISL